MPVLEVSRDIRMLLQVAVVPELKLNQNTVSDVAMLLLQPLTVNGVELPQVDCAITLSAEKKAADEAKIMSNRFAHLCVFFIGLF